MVETLQQNTDSFNGASNNTIRQIVRSRLGDFAQESFFGLVNNIVRRRLVDNSPQNPAVASQEMPKDEFISVKLNRGIGPVDQTLDSFRKIGETPDFEVISFTLGEQVAKAVQADWLNSGLTATVAALLNQPALFENASTGTIATNNLVDTLARFGDKAQSIRMWIMHSKQYYDLVKEQITNNITNVSDFNVATATPITLNRPVLVTDSPALISSTSPLQYYTLGLSENACVLEESEDTLLHTDIITGLENIVARMQGEYAFNVSLKGFKWDTLNGGVNPDDTALGTGTNWDKAASQDKDLAGVVLATL
jgi:hypothetical protein